MVNILALFGLWCLYQWSPNLLTTSGRHLADPYPRWRQELMIRFDRGALRVEILQREREQFPGFIPRGFRCTHYDNIPPRRLMHATSGGWSHQLLLTFPVFPGAIVGAVALVGRLIQLLRANGPGWVARYRRWRGGGCDATSSSPISPPEHRHP